MSGQAPQGQWEAGENKKGNKTPMLVEANITVNALGRCSSSRARVLSAGFLEDIYSSNTFSPS